MADSKEPVTQTGAEADEGEMSEAEIDQNLKDTFPASDPPSWTLGVDHGQASHNESHNKPSTESEDGEPE